MRKKRKKEWKIIKERDREQNTEKKRDKKLEGDKEIEGDEREKDVEFHKKTIIGL